MPSLSTLRYLTRFPAFLQHYTSARYPPTYITPGVGCDLPCPRYLKPILEAHLACIHGPRYYYCHRIDGMFPGIYLSENR